MRRLILTLSLAFLAFTPMVGAQETAATIDGKTTFDVVCASCHSINPPHKLAPPMSHVARNYRRAFETEAEGVEAIVQWVTKPERERSKMPAHVIENFGLMAAFPLPEAQLREVAKYVWSLGAPAADSAAGHGHRP